MEEIGQELQGRICVRVRCFEQVGSPFSQVGVREHKREEAGQVKAQRRDKY